MIVAIYDRICITSATTEIARKGTERGSAHKEAGRVRHPDLRHHGWDTQKTGNPHSLAAKVPWGFPILLRTGVLPTHHLRLS